MTFVYMKILESAPNRYDRGINILTFGKLNKIYEKLTKHISEGNQVLDIGVGTGKLAIRAAKRGAKVKGIDINPQMIDIAKKSAELNDVRERIEFIEMGVAELDREESDSYDVVMSGLCFSELTDGEVKFALKHIHRILKPQGYFLFVDEINPKNIFKYLLYKIVQIPLKIITYVLTQSTTRAIRNIEQKIQKNGLDIISVNYNNIGSIIQLVASKRE